MELRGEIYNTLSEWKEAETLAHESCVNFEAYTSNSYQSVPIKTTDNKFILVELEGFVNELKKVGFNFVKLDKSIIKVGAL